MPLFIVITIGHSVYLGPIEKMKFFENVYEKYPIQGI